MDSKANSITHIIDTFQKASNKPETFIRLVVKTSF